MNTIKWHIDCLKAMNDSRVRLFEEIQRRQAEYERLLNDCLFREQQIEEAIKQGKTSFDSERFLIKKKKGN